MTVAELRDALENFVDALHSETSVHDLEDFLLGRDVPDGRDVGGYEPEAWTEDNLIYEILENALHLEKQRFPYSSERNPERPDFELIDLDIIGENKVVNNYKSAVSDIKDYLKNKGIEEEFGLATDGLKWGLYRIETGGDFLEYDVVVELDLRAAVRQYASDRGYVEQDTLGEQDIDELLEEFFDTFSHQGLEHLIDTAPQQFRDDRKGTIQDFYDLYVELLFGEGSGDRTYDTTLIEDIDSPSSATETQERVFAVTLVNRLLFIKLLEDREVLPPGFLSQRVREFQQSRASLAGEINLYEDQIKPLFYELFNTQVSEREPRYQQGWFGEVPYLNGGLFRENVPGEKQYEVGERILPDLINDLIEGTELEEGGELDPVVLGSVFEMTINHISGEEGRQEAIGAYYTPNDATHLVTKRSVDAEIRETILDVFGDYYPEIRERSDEFPLDKMLRWIEDGTRWFADPEATEDAYERLGGLKIVDPACGSGHFLTSAMNELHRARISLMRGMGWDEEADWGARVYSSKEELALNVVYGVDVDPVAVEIAKLRVWLKIVEEGWEPEYGKLPNIDLNVVAGNSLIGLPVRAHGQVTLNLFESSVERIEELRHEYKQENEDVRGEITERLEELNAELTTEFIERLDHTFAFDTNVSNFEALGEGPVYVQESNFVDSVTSVTLRKSSVDELSDDESDWLDSNGFHSNPAWGPTARLEVTGSNSLTSLQEALERGFHVVKLERAPIIQDVEDIEGEPFHWVAGFPEAIGMNGDGGFDVIIGNPPYGRDVLQTSEQVILGGYETGSVNDIVAPFVERELQLLKDGGYFGNVATLKLVYQGETSVVRELIQRQLSKAKLVCFARRPTQVFEGCQVRTGILTGQKDTSEEGYDIQTSEFIRFFDNKARREREDVFRNIEFSSTEGLLLGERIGEGNEALPKIGPEMIYNIVNKLKDSSSTVLSEKMSRGSTDQTEHEVWRREGIAYFINPMLENLYPEDEKPREVKPMYFDSELERKAAFLILQSSLCYLYWMVYGNERHLPWKLVDAFPFPDMNDLESQEDEIIELSDELWQDMEGRFIGGSREVFRRAAELKPTIDSADDIIGPMYGLNEDEVEYVKQYQETYRLSSIEDEVGQQAELTNHE